MSGRWLGRGGKGGEGKEDEGGQRRTKEDEGVRRSTKEYKGVQMIHVSVNLQEICQENL